jgi:folylpolyglutamate synthase/dihydropteroate synthase
VTDQEINRAVAEARGATTSIGRMTVGNEPPLVLDVCGNPAAWGALMLWLQKHGECDVELVSDTDPDKDGAVWFATVWRAKKKYQEAEWESPGRALALAFLKAVAS